MTEKLTCEKIKAFVVDEEKGIRDYKAVGLDKLSHDESGHKKFLEDKSKKMGCK
jgi:hypothetical protein